MVCGPYIGEVVVKIVEEGWMMVEKWLESGCGGSVVEIVCTFCNLTLFTVTVKGAVLNLVFSTPL